MERDNGGRKILRQPLKIIWEKHVFRPGFPLESAVQIPYISIQDQPLTSCFAGGFFFIESFERREKQSSFFKYSMKEFEHDKLKKQQREEANCT